MVLLEIAQHYNVLNYLSTKSEPIAKVLRLPREAAFPLVVGLFLGIIFGAAIIIDYAREGRLSQRDMLLVTIFLSINHSIIEDSVLFASLGAQIIPVIFVRLLLALVLTRLAATYLGMKDNKLMRENGAFNNAVK